MNTNYLYLLRTYKYITALLWCCIHAWWHSPCYAQTQLPELRYNGLNYVCTDSSLFYGAQSIKQSGIEDLRAKLQLFKNMLTAKGFTDAVITSKEVRPANRPLIERLQQLGILQNNVMPDSQQLVQHIKQAQHLFDLEKDGVIGKASLIAFNTPLAVRIRELELAINTFEWLGCAISEQSVIVVNIPSANLKLFENGQMVLHSNIICGKPYTPTSTLAAPITEVILYPYWNVPYNIATKELLPQIKKSRSYLDANNLQVVNSAGKVVDPGSINWQALSRSNFPYRLRQATGCDNSLGIVKLNFHNPFTIYMHDTPTKSLFGRRKRFFSHGCMRVEKAMELARHMLTDTQPIDDIETEGCLKYQSPVVIPLQKKAAVFVLYNTAWTDEAGDVHFYGDAYNKINDVP